MIRDTATTPQRRLIVGLIALLSVGLLATGCSSSSKSSGGGGGTTASTTGSASGSGLTIHVKNFSFDPSTLAVAVGSKVTWVFDDSAQHTVTAADGSFKSGDLSSGGTYAFTFNKAGTYSYMCSIHQYMKATVTVK